MASDKNIEILTIQEILDKKFKGSKNGYNPLEVDRFIDKLILSINALNLKIESCDNENKKLIQQIENLKKEKDKIENDFGIFKNKFKYINEDDFIDNKSAVELLKKSNVYAEKLKALGIDVSKLY